MICFCHDMVELWYWVKNPQLILLENKKNMIIVIKNEAIWHKHWSSSVLQQCGSYCSACGERKPSDISDLLKLFWNPNCWIKLVENRWCLGNLCAVAWRLLVSCLNHREKEHEHDKNGPCWWLKSPWDSMSTQNTTQFPPWVICF